MIVKQHLPIGVRLWRWWCKHGIKNRTGGTIGGSFFERRLRAFYARVPSEHPSLGRLTIDGERILYFDAMDVHAHDMAIPQLMRSDPEILLAEALTPPQGAYLDVGANIGMMSLLALSESICRVYSFEPNPPLMNALRLTRKSSPLADRWHLFETAVGATQASLPLNIDSNFSGTASLNTNWQDGGNSSVVVPVTTLDNWVETERIQSIDVIKIDVEGYESEALQGAINALVAHQPYVWFEHNLPALRRGGLNPERVLDILAECGYEDYYDIGLLPDRRPVLTRGDISRIPDARLNLLAVPARRQKDFQDRVLPAMSAAL